MSTSRHETKALLIHVIGEQAASALMSAKNVAGCAFHVPKSLTGAGIKKAELLNGIIGQQATEKLVSCMGGEVIYIPRNHEGKRMLRNRKIVEAYSQGRTVQDIAYEFDMSDRWVWAILKTTDMSVTH